jgi:hypothetical protein
MFDEESDPIYQRIICQPKYTPAELITIERLGWERKAMYTTTIERKTRVAMITRAFYIISMLMLKGGFYAVKEILKYLSVKEFALIAAASDTLLMEFFTVEGLIAKKMSSWLCQQYKNWNLIPNMNYMCSLPNGQALRKELKLFQLSTNLLLEIDEFWWLPIKNIKRMSVEFNPCYPIVAVQSSNNVYILTYQGQYRKMNGQILYCIARNTFNQHIQWFSWNNTGHFLLLATKERNFEAVPSDFIFFAVCTYMLFFKFFK